MSSAEYAALAEMHAHLADLQRAQPPPQQHEAGPDYSAYPPHAVPAPHPYWDAPQHAGHRTAPPGPGPLAAPPGSSGGGGGPLRLFVGKLSMGSTAESVLAYFAAFLWRCGFPDPHGCIKDVYLPSNGEGSRGEVNPLRMSYVHSSSPASCMQRPSAPAASPSSPS